MPPGPTSSYGAPGGALMAEVSIGPKRTFLGGANLQALGRYRKQFTMTFGSSPKLWFRHLCSARDYEAYGPKDSKNLLFAGEVMVSSQDEGLIFQLLEFFRLHWSGGILVEHGYAMLLYPVRLSEAWGFIEPGLQFPPGTWLRLLIFGLTGSAGMGTYPLSSIENSAGAVGDGGSGSGGGSENAADAKRGEILPYRRTLPNIFKYMWNVELKMLLNRNERKSASIGNFFLLGPASAAAEICLWVDALQSLGVKNIHVSSETGAWDYFRNVYSHGTILIHPSFESIYRIPGLADILGKSISLFKFGVTETGFVVQPLFPYGSVILLTDSLILRNPIAAEKVISWFAKSIRNRPPGTWKLVGRPGLKDWALAVANKACDEQGHESEEVKARVQIWLHLNDLLPANLLTTLPWSSSSSSSASASSSSSSSPPSCSAVPKADAPVFWDDLPFYAPPPPQLSRTAPSSSMAAAWAESCHDQQLAQWFCGWAFRRIDTFRRFIAVHPVAAELAALRAASLAVDFVTPDDFFEKYARASVSA